jgi:transmembrane sensor
VPRPNAVAGRYGFQDLVPAVTPEIGAEAAVWVAQLHGPDRSSQMERECLSWQDRSAVHRLAFERCTDTWQDVGRLTLSSYAAATGATEWRAGIEFGRNLRRTRWSFAHGITLAVLTTGGLAVLQPWCHIDTYFTGVGEQRMALLADGTRMSLNTATRVRVELGPAQRTVRLEGGEALFEVAKDTNRPFVVRAGGSEVVAVGTVFSVRMTPEEARVGDALAVTLIEGRLTVRPAPDSSERGSRQRSLSSCNQETGFGSARWLIPRAKALHARKRIWTGRASSR